MKTKFFLTFFALMIAGCSESYDDNVIGNRAKTLVDVLDAPQVTVLRATSDVDDITDVSILCVDGVKYLIIPGFGVTIKYRNSEASLPVPEQCDNK